jgi:REP element-mobilizing transposase RayT
MTVTDRQHGWLTMPFLTNFRVVLTNVVTKYHVVVPAYCLMPDHLHLLAAGTTLECDQLLWARAVRRAINRLLSPCKLQKQAYDHVLRPTEHGQDAFAALVSYICENPVRAKLVENAEQWPYSGACVPAVPAVDPRHTDFRETWWAYWHAVQE